MTSTFFGLEIGRRALQAHQRSLDITGHNISNASTTGYSRQVAVLTTTDPYAAPGINGPMGAGQIGTGVEVEAINRVRDEFLDAQVRTENKSLGYWDVKREAMEKVEVIVNEPSDSGLRTVLDQFWEGWQQLSKDPQSGAVRSVIQQRGIAVAETLNHLNRLYNDLQKDTNDSIKIKLDSVNSIGQQIADINKQVVAVEAGGDKANDLRDKRDELIDQLSKIVNVQYQEDELGAVNVWIANGNSLVRGANVTSTLSIDTSTPYNDIVYDASGTKMDYSSFRGGELKGLLEVRGYDNAGVTEGIIPGLLADLDNVANAIITNTNTLHQGGYDLTGNLGGVFFSGTSAGDIAVDAAILASTDKIAAGSEAPVAGVPVVGSGDNALKLAQLKQTAVTMGGFTGTIDDFYRAQIGKIGVDSEEAARMVDNQDLLVQQLDQRRQSVSGVSLDEEMTNMLQFQHAYNAAAKVLNSFDEMLNVIINGLGAGR